jgi:hypothetical protein
VNWFATFVRRVVLHSFRKSRDFAILNFNIVSRPAQTGAILVLDHEPAGLVRALKFYSKAFALAFALYLIANRFQLYEGLSESRILITYFLQLISGIAVVYLLTFVLPDRIPLFRLVQTALYVDGTFLITAAIASIPISLVAAAIAPIPVSYFKLGIPTATREVDIFSTEYESCLAHNSPSYWLLRGDLKYYLYSDAWKPAGWVNWFLDKYEYVLMIPFLFALVFMLRPKRKISIVLLCLVAAVTAVAV